MRKSFSAALAAVAAIGMAFGADEKKDTKAGCEPPPTQLVKKDLKEGDGKVVEFRTPILAGYTGWLYEPCAPDHKGAKFDSSEGRSTPFGFVVGAGRVIKGWDEGVIGMKEHGKRLLVIPPDKGYGERGAGGGKIPPNATLVFEVEVVEVLGSGPSVKTVPAPKK
ncbi:MAG TPA: FKBP-type peptidyl-prolyl cis-trans isomerase [Usitatibacter sp.]|nr:FKBP-type peptidyl-prolyl cis-trans isomerase [Usitatibacter sp.]